MATVSRSRRNLDPRSGGKIVRPRRAAARSTPYDRPAPRFANPPPAAENPNWISKLIFSPTRAVVSGAGKLICTVFGPDDESSTSSSSSSEGTDDDDDDEISTPGDEGLKKKNGASERINIFRKEPPTTVGQSNNKHAIEQMLMQETFSREECERLIKIIKSRVEGFTTFEDAEYMRQCTPDLRGTAVTEAKKWLEEKRLGSSSKSDMDLGTGTLMFPQGAEDEGGSPVDVAKSYMRARPPWASPSINPEELRSPSSIGMKLFNEETPHSFGGPSVSSSKLKRDTPATGAWNIQEELRRVRSKASEELLMSLPSTRIDCSGSAVGTKSTCGLLRDRNSEDEMRDKDGNAVVANVNLSSKITMPSGSEVLEQTQYVLQKEALPTPAVNSCEQNQDVDVAIDGNGGASGNFSEQRLEAVEDMKTAPSDAGATDFYGRKDTNESEQEHPLVGGTIEDFELHDIVFLAAEEVTGSRSAYTTNGFPSSIASMPAELGREENAILNGEINQVSSSHENVARNLTADEAREFVMESVNEEAAIETSNKNENDVDDTKDNNEFVLSGSQNSSSMPDEPSEELTQPTSKKRTPVAKTSTVVEKPKGTRVTKYNRRGRARKK